MTNNELQAIIDQYGDRMFAIGMDNNKTLLLDYPKSDSDLIVRRSDITFETFEDGTDVMKVHRIDKQSTSPVKFTIMHLSEFIEYVGNMDVNYGKYRPQVNGFK